MKNYRCTVRNQSGKISVQNIEADSQSRAIEMLNAQDLFILSVIDTPTNRFSRRAGRKKVKNDQLVMCVRQLATMVAAGLPLLQCLQTLEEQEEPGKLKEILRNISDDVTQGQALSEALTAHPAAFDKLFVSMVRAGETGGFLAEILERLANYMENAAALRRKIKSAMMYPTIVITIAMGITILLIVKVVPVFEGMFKDFNAQLPLPTRIMINTSNFLRSYGIVVVGVLVGLGFLFRWYNRTPSGKLRVDIIKFSLPLFGPLIQKISVARFTSTLSALVESGVPIIRSLEIVSETSGNEVINKVLRDAMARTEKGEPIAESMRSSKHIPNMVTKMIEIGEATGKLDRMLERIATFYTDQVNATVNGLTSLIEPILIVFLGVVVGGIIISMFMPIFQLSDVVG